MGGNLRRIADEARVSIATASRVLSGSDYPVSEVLRQRVLDVAQRLDYVPNAQARALIRGSTTTVGMLVGEVGDPYFDAMINGTHRVATEESLLVTIVETGRDPHRELECFRLLQSHGAGVIIVAGSGMDDPAYQAGLTARIRGFPGTTVLVGRHDGDDDALRVVADNVEAGRLLGAHLAGLGHERVGVLSGLGPVTSTGDRLAGLAAGLGREPRVLEVTPTRDGGYSGAGALLAADPGITAVVGTADQMAIGALAYCSDHGIRVPQDVSVAGCNDIWVARDLTPSLTTVHLPLQEMGAAALRLAVAARGGSAGGDGAVDGAPATAAFPVDLVVRGSTGPVRGAAPAGP